MSPCFSFEFPKILQTIPFHLSEINMSSPPANPQQIAQLFQEVQVQLARLKQEVDGHNVTRTLLLQTQTNARHWEQQAVSFQGQVHFLESKLSTVEARCQQLVTDNERLHSVVKHLVRFPNST